MGTACEAADMHVVFVRGDDFKGGYELDGTGRVPVEPALDQEVAPGVGASRFFGAKAGYEGSGGSGGVSIECVVSL